MATQVRKTKTVDRILDAASDLFYLHGLRGVGIEQVIERSGVAKSTLYVHFRTKEDLVVEYLRRTDESWRSRMREAAEAAGPDPADQLVGLFDALLDAFDRHGFFGCPFVSAAVESAPDSRAREIAVAHAQRRHDWLAELCRQAGAPDPQSLARQIGLLVEGALTAGRLLQDRAVVDDAKRAAAELVRGHVGLRVGPAEPVAATG